MEKIDVITFNEDGSISFQGQMNAQQASFILNVGINFLLSQGASLFEEEDDDEDLPETNAPTTGTVQ